MNIGAVTQSLTVRLSLLFMLVSLTILSAMGLFLHHALSQQVTLRDAQDLNGKIELVRHTLVDIDSLETMQRFPERWREIVVGHHGLHLALYSTEGALLVSSSELRLPQAVLKSPGSDTSQNLPVIEWEQASDRRFRAVSAWGRLGKSPQDRVLIALALDVSEELKLLAAYRASIVIAIMVGTILAGALGVWVSKRGLAPLQAVAGAAGRITASRMDERLDAGAVPKELQRLASAYNAMLDRLEDSFSRLSQFSADLAHDLRTPVGNLLGEAQVALSKSRTAPEYRLVIESSVEELERLSRMIESMLFLARADNAQLALHPEPIALDVAFAKIRDYFEPLAQEKGIAVEGTSTATVYADALLLTRAMGNLVANAIQATPKTGGVIELAARTMPDGGTEIRVSNPGAKIRPAERERIFDRFYRIGQARADSARGSGLGLAIVKSIVTLHGGHVGVDCDDGKTTFTMTFLPPR